MKCSYCHKNKTTRQFMKGGKVPENVCRDCLRLTGYVWAEGGAALTAHPARGGSPARQRLA